MEENNNEVSNAAKTYIKDVNVDTNNEVIGAETPAKNDSKSVLDGRDVLRSKAR